MSRLFSLLVVIICPAIALAQNAPRPAPIVSPEVEAGGRVTNLVGGPVDLNTPEVVASNGRIHEEMLAVLRHTRQA